jgi:hypothetical protein
MTPAESRRLQQLHAAWEANELNEAGLDEFKKLLTDPQARQELASQIRLSGALVETLCTWAVTTEAAHPITALTPKFLTHASGSLLHTWFKIAAVIALGAFTAWLIAHDRQAAPQVGMVKGEVHLAYQGEKRPATAGMRLRHGERVLTSVNAQAQLIWKGETTRILLHPGSDIEWMQTATGKRLWLHTGKLDADVAPQPRHKPMTLLTAESEAQVLGTVFTLSSQPSKTTLVVKEGRVLVGGTEAETSVIATATQVVAIGPDRLPKTTRLPTSESTELGLIGHWAFDDPGNPDSPDQTCEMGPLEVAGDARYREHAAGGCLDLMSAGAHVFSKRPWLPPAVFTISMRVWLKEDLSFDAPMRALFTTSPSGFNSQGFRLFVNRAKYLPNQELSFETGNGLQGAAARTAAKVVPFAQWCHIAAVVNLREGTATLLVDGKEHTKMRNILTDFPHTSSFNIGQTEGNIAHSLKGYVDDVRVYSRALLSEEIVFLAQKPAPNVP